MKDEILCPECEGPCTISWSGLELVENTGDETLAKKHFHSKAPDLLAALVEARDTMQSFYLKSDKVNLILAKINKLLNEETK